VPALSFCAAWLNRVSLEIWRVAMVRVVGVDHIVLSVGDFARSREFYRRLLGFLGFKLKYDYADMAGWRQPQDAILDRRRRRTGEKA
jgi:Glyoxalase/Bleomycin resistance protein/Dioxygenase superfamily